MLVLSDSKLGRHVDGASFFKTMISYETKTQCVCDQMGGIMEFNGNGGFYQVFSAGLLSVLGLLVFIHKLFLISKQKGLNFDFVLLNLTKHSSYLIYNASVFFSSAVQLQYHQKYGFNQIIPVAPNDVAFSIHAVVLTAFTLFQITIYDRGGQKVSKTSISILSVAWLTVILYAFIAIPNHSWFWLVSCFSTLQVVMTVIKYIPQAVMNFKRKSTIGFSIGNILLDLFGGLANYGQMVVQSLDQHSWVNFYGNIGKTLLSLVSIFFDLLFILQHYVLYPATKTGKSQSPDLESEDPLVTSLEDA